VANPVARSSRRQSRLSRFFFKDNVPLPTDDEIAAAQHHVEEELHDAVQAGSAAAAEIEGYPKG
jgi:hypothetical protein